MCLGIPSRVVRIDGGEPRMATVELSGIKKSVCIEHVPEVQPGDFVLVHVGFAISRIDEEEAGRIFALLAELA